MRRNENTILGMSFMRAFGSGKSTPQWVRRRLKGQSVGPARLRRAKGRSDQDQASRKPDPPPLSGPTPLGPQVSGPLRCLLARRARASEDLSQ